MTIADIEYFVDDVNNVTAVEIKKFCIVDEYRILNERLCLEKDKIYKLNLRNPEKIGVIKVLFYKNLFEMIQVIL